MIVYVLTVHILLSKVTSFVLEDLAVHRQDLWEKTNLCLLLQLISRVAVYEHSFSSCVGVKVEKPKIFIFVMEVHYYLFHRVDGGMCFGIRIDVASVKIDSVGIHSVCTTGYPIRIEDREQIEDKFVPQQSRLVRIFCELLNDSCHHMGTGHLSWMDSCSNNE
jgi:hypothetical protein